MDLFRPFSDFSLSHTTGPRYVPVLHYIFSRASDMHGSFNGKEVLRPRIPVGPDVDKQGALGGQTLPRTSKYSGKNRETNESAP